MAVSWIWISSAVVGLLSAVGGLFLFTPYPKMLGFYSRQVKRYPHKPQLVGMTPAHYYGTEWKFKPDVLQEEVHLGGQRALVTGANSGIGYELAKGLVELGADSVTLACRDPRKCREAVDRIGSEVVPTGDKNSRLETLTMDTSSMSSVREAAREFLERSNGTALDMLFLNAGFVYSHKSNKCVPSTEEDNIEVVFAANYVGHHLLYRWLEPLLQKSKVARIVSTSSAGSFTTYSYKVATDLETLNGCSEPMMKGIVNLSYGQSKLAQLVWTKELTKRLGHASSIFVNAFHPGMADSGIWAKTFAMARVPQFIVAIVDWMRRDFMWSSKLGAFTGLFLGANAKYVQENNIRGLYFHPQGELMTNPFAENQQLQADLWDFTESLVMKYLPPKDDSLSGADVAMHDIQE